MQIGDGNSGDKIKNLADFFENSLLFGSVSYMEEDDILSLFDYYVDKDNNKYLKQLLEIGLEQHPSSVDILLYKANFLASDNQIQEAKNILNYLLPMETTNSDVYIGFGWIELVCNNIEPAIAYFDKAVLYSDDDDILWEIGQNLNQNGFHNESIKYLENYVKNNKNNASAYFELGYAYNVAGRIDDSISQYEKMLEIDPYHERCWYNLGIQYNKSQQHEKAINAYDMAISLNPDYPEPYFNRGNVYMNSQKFDLALDSYLDYASFKTELTSLIYQYLGDCMEELSEFSYAIRFFKKAIEMDPRNPDAYYGYATSLMWTSSYQEGIEAIRMSLEIDNTIPDYYFVLAQGYIETNNVDGAIAAIESAIDIEPNEILAWIELVKLKFKKSKRFNVHSFGTKAVKKYGKDNLALIYLKAYVSYYFDSDIDSTKEYIQEALDSDSTIITDIMDEASEMIGHPQIYPIVKKYIDK